MAVSRQPVLCGEDTELIRSPWKTDTLQDQNPIDFEREIYKFRREWRGSRECVEGGSQFVHRVRGVALIPTRTICFVSGNETAGVWFAIVNSQSDKGVACVVSALSVNSVVVQQLIGAHSRPDFGALESACPDI